MPVKVTRGPPSTSAAASLDDCRRGCNGGSELQAGGVAEPQPCRGFVEVGCIPNRLRSSPASGVGRGRPWQRSRSRGTSGARAHRFRWSRRSVDSVVRAPWSFGAPCCAGGPLSAHRRARAGCSDARAFRHEGLGPPREFSVRPATPVSARSSPPPAVAFFRRPSSGSRHGASFWPA